MGHYVPHPVSVDPITLGASLSRFTHKVAEKHYQKCEYCDSWYDKSLTKCPNCYAPAKMMEVFPDDNS